MLGNPYTYRILFRYQICSHSATVGQYERKRFRRQIKQIPCHIGNPPRISGHHVRIGRQNPQYYEVLDGLEPGERVIVSGYENYGSNDVLILNK